MTRPAASRMAAGNPDCVQGRDRRARPLQAEPRRHQSGAGEMRPQSVQRLDGSGGVATLGEPALEGEGDGLPRRHGDEETELPAIPSARRFCCTESRSSCSGVR